MTPPLPRWFVMVLAMALPSCGDWWGTSSSRHPGELLGTYEVSAVIDPESSCATVLATAPNPWSFRLELRRQGSDAFWVQNESPVRGAIRADGTISFVTTQQYHIEPTSTPQSKTAGIQDWQQWQEVLSADQTRRDAGAARCLIQRTDRFDGQVTETADAGSSQIRGTLNFSYVAAAGSDCSAAVGVPPERPGAVWGNLPCTARFAIEGRASR